MNRILGGISFVMFCSMSTWTSAFADSGEPAVTKVSDADQDFSFMGEYMGKVDGQLNGLQVIARGDGQYQASLLDGGLPGSGWDRQGRRVLEGSRDGSALMLREDGFVIEINGGKAVVRNDQEEIGSLNKVSRRSAHAGLPPVPGAVVLFDGTDTSAFDNPRVVDGFLQVGADLKPTFRNYHLHVEFLVPYMPDSQSQARGNSGVYLQSRYEIQILDSFGLEGVYNECGALYKQRRPDLNMAFPPLSWQTYDITFYAPKFNARCKKVANARVTVLHNGVPIHDHVRIKSKTGAGKPEGPIPLPIRFQDHSNPVQFRNIWIKPL